MCVHFPHHICLPHSHDCPIIVKQESEDRRMQQDSLLLLLSRNTISKNDSPMRKIVSESRSRSESDPHDVNILQRVSPPSPIKSHKCPSASSASTSRRLHLHQHHNR